MVQKTLKTSVRNLVEFILRQGDLAVGGFQRRDRAAIGIWGHQRIQKSRPDGYKAEVAIAHVVERAELRLEIFGRIDGIFAAETPLFIEEIKTTTAETSAIGEDYNPLHWAQAQCYAYMYALQHNLAEIGIQLTYYQIDTHELKEFRRLFAWPDLERFFNELVETYLEWLKEVQAWLEQRDQSIQQLQFPYPGYRQGQREMAVAVYKTIRQKERLFVQAPTGIGKTIAALFPAVKAIGLELATKIFYLTAKTPGRTVAEKALDDLRQAGLHFKSVTLTAKEKICFCAAAGGDPELCEFTKNYYHKARTALRESYHLEAFTRPVVEELARRYELCPFEFSLDLALWVECIICDYNYAFDPRVYLRRFFDQTDEPYIFLIDEAHNLPDRAREMYSAELDKRTVLELKKLVKPHLPEVATALQEINQAMLEKRRAGDGPALIEQELPETLLAATRRFIQQAESWLALNHPADFRPALLEFYFQCNSYVRTADYFEAWYVSYFEKQDKSGLKTKLFCLDPAPLLQIPLARSQAAIFFSATLLPLDYFQQVLTGSTANSTLMLSSPFPQENSRLLIHNRISTRYARRQESYEAIAAAIETICAARQGNYLIFFPSYAYLAAVVELLRLRLPEEQLLIQAPGMKEVDRDAFLAHFSDGNTATLIGFAVMGGIFGEGIDLAGERLIGAVIIGVGLPQLCLERDLIRDYFDRQNRRGFEYAYQYPGLNRAMQAAGRVIRSEQDQGVIVLIDDRFTQPRYTSLFPQAWRHFRVVQNVAQIREQLGQFWSAKRGERA
jgi:DNA excision repair protein ERCC-2